jgi:hypothetical protein
MVVDALELDTDDRGILHIQLRMLTLFQRRLHCPWLQSDPLQNQVECMPAMINKDTASRLAGIETPVLGIRRDRWSVAKDMPVATTNLTECAAPEKLVNLATDRSKLPVVNREDHTLLLRRQRPDLIKLPRREHQRFFA